MTKKKSTKRALISSLLILAMCFTMLAGTTFAWFTDSVTSGSNIIKSGKLDVDLLVKGGNIDTTDNSLVAETDGYYSLDKNTGLAVFNYDLWEPGYTVVVADMNQHYHYEDETHNELLVFDQLIGAGAGGTCVRTLEGVTVIYLNGSEPAEN